MTGKRIYQDPQLHVRYNPFLKSRAQAWYRKEEWSLNFEEWCSLWTWDKWQLRGKASSDFAMVRIDYEKGWSLANCEIVTRREQLRRNSAHRVEIKRLQHFVGKQYGT